MASKKFRDPPLTTAVTHDFNPKPLAETLPPVMCIYCNKRPGDQKSARGKPMCSKCQTPRAAQPPKKPPITVGRNDPCPCKSGRKFKHCHLRKTSELT